MSDELSLLRAVTRRRQKADNEWREAIRTAVSDGLSLRQVANAAGITHVGVLRITQRTEMAERQHPAVRKEMAMQKRTRGGLR
jgi:transposase-like protein